MPPFLAVQTTLEAGEASSRAGAAVSFYFLLMAVVCVAAWWVAIRYWWRHGFLLRQEPVRDVAWELGDILIVAALWLGSQALAIFLASSLGDFDVRDVDLRNMSNKQVTITVWTSACVEWVVLLLLLALLGARCGFEATRLGFSRKHVPRDIYLGLIAFLMVVPPVIAVQAIGSQLMPQQRHPFIDALTANPGIEVLVAIVFAAVFTAPFFEEFLFRLIIQGWLDRILRGGWNPSSEATAANTAAPEDMVPTKTSRRHPAAILIASIVFACAHMNSGPAVFALFFFSIGLGYLFQRTGRLTPCIVLHLALNTQTSVLLFVQMQAPEAFAA